jgi:hypothetical protein
MTEGPNGPSAHRCCSVASGSAASRATQLDGPPQLRDPVCAIPLLRAFPGIASVVAENHGVRLPGESDAASAVGQAS